METPKYNTALIVGAGEGLSDPQQIGVTVRKVSALRQRMIDDMTVRNFAPNTR